MMKKLIATIGVFLSLVLIAGFAHAYTIDDSTTGATTYYGGLPNHGSWNDIISGSLYEFALTQMDVGISGNLMTVKVTGPYFYNYNHNVGLAGGYGPGDLYINPTGWIRSGTAPHFPQDTFTNAEGWTYVAHLDTIKGGGISGGAIYSFDWNTGLMTEAPGYIYRTSQAWKGGYGTNLGAVAGSFDDTGLTYIIDISGLGLGSEVGLHWAMRCGNDVIEGQASVPEPGILILLGIGLSSVGLLARRFKF